MEIENIKVKEFLDTDQYELYKFNASEKTFGYLLKALQFEGNLNSISNIFRISLKQSFGLFFSSSFDK